MTDKVTKEIAKFTKKEKEILKELLVKIKSQNFEGLNKRKVTNTELWRVKKGQIRIQFTVNDNKVLIEKISRRSEKTYKNN